MEDETKRKVKLQAYLDNTCSPSAAQVIGENIAYEKWAHDTGLKWK